jgi:hypothetical protein
MLFMAEIDADDKAIARRQNTRAALRPELEFLGG